MLSHNSLGSSVALSGIGLGSVQGKNGEYCRDINNKDIEYLNIEEVTRLNEKLNDANLFSRTSKDSVDNIHHKSSDHAGSPANSTKVKREMNIETQGGDSRVVRPFNDSDM